jgi:hypothetical protein
LIPADMKALAFDLTLEGLLRHVGNAEHRLQFDQSAQPTVFGFG